MCPSALDPRLVSALQRRQRSDRACSAGANLEAVGPDGLTPLMIAAKNGHLDAIRTLNEFGVSLLCWEGSKLTAFRGVIIDALAPADLKKEAEQIVEKIDRGLKEKSQRIVSRGTWSRKHHGYNSEIHSRNWWIWWNGGWVLCSHESTDSRPTFERRGESAEDLIELLRESMSEWSSSFASEAADAGVKGLQAALRNMGPWLPGEGNGPEFEKFGVVPAMEEPAMDENAERRYFAVHPSPEATGHRVGQPVGDCVEGDLSSSGASVLLTLDLGAVRQDLAGTQVLFLELPPVFSIVDLRRTASGRFELVHAGDTAARGARFDVTHESAADLWSAIDDELEESLAELAEDFTDKTGISLGDSVELRPSSNSDYSRSNGWSHSTTAPWVQARREVDFGVASDQWIYVGTVESNWYFGCVHGFYNTETQVMRNIFECT